MCSAGIRCEVMRRAGVALALCALVLPAGAEVPPELLVAAQRMPAASQLDPVTRSAPCLFAEGVRHLDPLPAAQPWTRPEAIVVFHGLPGQPEGGRAALMRPTREMMARLATRSLLASGNAMLFDDTLAPLPPDAPTPAFLAVVTPAGTAPPIACMLRTRR